MIYIFEDDPNDVLSLLFKTAYGEEITSNFIYTKGNGKIYEISEQKLIQTSEEIVVYLDMVPGNRDIVKLYYKIKHLSKSYENRLTILPIVCSEYYFIKSIKNTNLVINKAEIDRCINKDVYFDSVLISTEEDRRFCRNFEKYCKLVLMKNVADCIRHTSGREEVNRQNMIYYNHDCKCDYPLDGCFNQRVIEKSIRFLKQYPCIPIGTHASGTRKLSEKDVRDIHIKLVTEFNSMVLKYMDNDIDNSSSYKTIT